MELRYSKCGKLIYNVEYYRYIVVDGLHILWLFSPYGRRTSLLCLLNDIYVVLITINDTLEFYSMNLKYNDNIYFIYFLNILPFSNLTH